MISSNPLVSVIIPTYKRAAVLERAIKSVLAQSYECIELIIVNDGRDLETRALLERYESYSKVRVLTSLEQGVSAARNKGWLNAKGDLIAFLDSDDEWLVHKLAVQVDFLQQNPTIDWVHTQELWIRNGVRVNQMKKHRKGGGDQFIPSLDLCLISPSTVLLKKELLNENGGFNENYLVCEDYDLWLRLSCKYPVGFISEACIKKYGGHDDQLSRKYKAMDYYRVKSIDYILRTKELSSQQREKALVVLKKKSNILLKGYLKHNNLEHYDEIYNILSFHK